MSTTNRVALILLTATYGDYDFTLNYVSGLTTSNCYCVKNLNFQYFLLWRTHCGNGVINMVDTRVRLDPGLNPLEALQSDVAHSGDGVITSEHNVDVAGALELAHLSF
jgi:hypothetical protein